MKNRASLLNEIDKLIDPNGKRHTMVIFVRGIYVSTSGQFNNSLDLREQIKDCKKTHSTGASLYTAVPYDKNVTVECCDVATAEALIETKNLTLPGVEVSDFHWNIFDLE